MKYVNILAILLLSSALPFYGCNEKTADSKAENPITEGSITEAPKTEVADTIKATNITAQPNVVTPAEPAQNAAGVWHYTCSKGCAGGAGAAGNCATCGGPLAHNQAYHGSANNMPATNPMTTPAATPAPAPTTATQATTPPQTTEPAQNAAGVWHYTCPKGCAGGAGSAAPCATCGGTLEHNQAYHK
jgi:hypothetical protein